MKIERIECVGCPQSELNGCLDVIVSLKDEYCDKDFYYVIEVITPEHLCTLMKENESAFLPPRYPYIVVSKLTHEIIEDAIKAFIDEKEDSYWLKFYHVIATLDIEDLNELLERKKKQQIELTAKIDAEVEAEMAAELASETEAEKDKDRND